MMLQPPGSSSSGSRSSVRSSRRSAAAQEKPEDAIRRLQRLPPNKRCADCSSKLPQVVNLTFGTFVCLPCSGVHREFSHRVKGINQSSFTSEEVTRLKDSNAGNEAVNSRYLAKYDRSKERMKPPTDNHDLQLLRVWIRRKYLDKAWYDDGSGGDGGKGGREKKEVKRGKGSSIKGKGRKDKPSSSASAVASAPAPSHDLLGGWDDAPAPAPPAPAPAASASSWDAFGGGGTAGASAQPPQPDAFQANFDQAEAPAAAASQQPPPPQQQQQQNFASFDQQQPPQNQQPQGQDGNFANFDGPPQQQQQPPMAPPQMTQQQPLPMAPQNENFANFAQQQQPPQQQQQPPQQQQPMVQQQPTQQQPQTAQQQGNFVNFHQQPSNPPPAAMQQQTQMAQPNSFQANFGQPPQQQQPTVQQQLPQQQQPNGFANFAQQRQGDAQHQQQQHQQSAFASSGHPQTTMQPQQQGGFANFDRQMQMQFQRQQQQMHPSPSQKPAPDQPQQQMPQPTLTQPTTTQPPLTTSQQPQPTQVGTQTREANSCGVPPPPPPGQGTETMPASQERRNAFEAFASLSMEPDVVPAAAGDDAETNGSRKPGGRSDYKQGQEATYTDNGGNACTVAIRKVHYDDELVPYYTVVLPNGNEKQTDDAHLSPAPAVIEGGPPSSSGSGDPLRNGTSGSQQMRQVVEALEGLSPEQLRQVFQYAVRLKAQPPQNWGQPPPTLPHPSQPQNEAMMPNPTGQAQARGYPHQNPMQGPNAPGNEMRPPQQVPSYGSAPSAIPGQNLPTSTMMPAAQNQIPPTPNATTQNPHPPPTTTAPVPPPEVPTPPSSNAVAPVPAPPPPPVKKEGNPFDKF